MKELSQYLSFELSKILHSMSFISKSLPHCYILFLFYFFLYRLEFFFFCPQSNCNFVCLICSLFLPLPSKNSYAEIGDSCLFTGQHCISLSSLSLHVLHKSVAHGNKLITHFYPLLTICTRPDATKGFRGFFCVLFFFFPSILY